MTLMDAEQQLRTIEAWCWRDDDTPYASREWHDDVSGLSVYLGHGLDCSASPERTGDEQNKTICPVQVQCCGYTDATRDLTRNQALNLLRGVI